jgi:hypothetical protein
MVYEMNSGQASSVGMRVAHDYRDSNLRQATCIVYVVANVYDAFGPIPM